MKIYYNGDIVTMNGGRVCEALLEDGGKIKAVGTLEEIKKLAGTNAQTTDLGGKALLPGFIDAHSHFVQFAGSLRFVSMAKCKAIDEICDTLIEYREKNQIDSDAWIIGFGYDHNNLAEKRHPTKQELDRISRTNPVLISHTSGHMGCVNSRALELSEIDENTENPQGGVIGRVGNTKEPSGYLEETAFMGLASGAPQPSEKEMLTLLKRAQEIYFSFGVTTAQDGLMKDMEFSLLKAADDTGVLKLDVIGYADIKSCPELVSGNPGLAAYHGHFKIGGYKLFLDGSPQGRTAWLTEPYTKQDDQPDDYSGYAIYKDKEVDAYVEKAEKEGRQLLTHCNGDAAIDQLLNAHKKPTLNRNVIIHAQTIRLDQLERVKYLGLMPSYFVAHTYYWGDTHIKNLGAERAGIISPIASTEKLGIPFTFHQDSPVLVPDMIDTVWCAVNRVTKGGVQLSPDEAVSIETALRGVTANGAYQYFEESTKGTLEAGKRADMVILSENPLNVQREKLREIKVSETIKDGESVFKR
ncbi:MAG: amidohydrolase [Oscillospiraceae bacterium]